MLNGKKVNLILTGIFLLGMSVSLVAGEIDAKSTILCKLSYLQICENDDHSCDWAEVVHDDGDQILIIDPLKKQISLFVGDEQYSRSKIDKIGTINHQVFFHGLNPESPIAVNGTGWIARVSKASGKLSVALLADLTGYFIFGTCQNK